MDAATRDGLKLHILHDAIDYDGERVSRCRITCCRCGVQPERHAPTTGDALSAIMAHMERRGWRLADNLYGELMPICGDCREAAR